MIELLTLRPGKPRERRVTATLTNGKWQCDDKEFLAILDIIQLPTAYYPDRDAALVAYVHQHYGGEVVDHRPKQEEPEELVAY